MFAGSSSSMTLRGFAAAPRAVCAATTAALAATGIFRI